MELTVTPEIEKLISERLGSGAYASPEEVVLAGLLSLEQTEQFGDFQPGELDSLLKEGEHSLNTGPAIPASELFREIEQLEKADQTE